MRRRETLPGAPEAPRPAEVARVTLPTPAGEFEARAFQGVSGAVYLALVRGLSDPDPDPNASGTAVLTRLHSECLTGDALGSLRCDCGVQLQLALRAIAAAGRGVLLYATGQEGRGIGLINKLRSYAEQDQGADTLEANLRLGLPIDARDYREAAGVLHALGVRTVRLLTNNPIKVGGLQAAGITVESIQPLATAPHVRNLAYLQTKERRLGHVRPTGERLDGDISAEVGVPPAVDATSLLGQTTPHPDRPYVVLKFAQTLDGRIATATGDARWISGEAERRVSHALRAASDAVMVGVGTILQDDPQLTVRMVAGVSPVRVVLDSTLRVPSTARVLEAEATTLVLTTEASDPARRAQLCARQIGVEVLPPGPDGVDLAAALARLRASGVRSLLVEGGARVITSMLRARVVDRLVVGVAPTIIGSGTEAVGGLGITSVAAGIRLRNRLLHVLDEDVLLCWDVAR